MAGGVTKAIAPGESLVVDAPAQIGVEGGLSTFQICPQPEGMPEQSRPTKRRRTGPDAGAPATHDPPSVVRFIFQYRAEIRR